MNKQFIAVSTSGLFSIAATHAFNSSCRADVTASAYGGATSFNYKVSYMPDLDQRRWRIAADGLPGNGNFYCVPTSMMNIFAYAADHGYPTTPPGIANWQSQSQYATATNELEDLGFWMGTNPSGGTSPENAVYGARMYVGDGSLLTFDTFLVDDSWAPKIQDAALQATLHGKLIALVYGRYDYFGEIGGVVITGGRNSGHMVTLVTAQRSGNVIKIGVRDPADDPDENTNPVWQWDQSPFTTRVFLEAEQVNAGGRFMTAMIYPPPGSRIALIDKMIAVGLRYGLTFQNSATAAIRQIRPVFFAGTPEPDYEYFWDLGLGNIQDALMSADDSKYTYILYPTGGSAQVASLNPATGTSTPVLTNTLAPHRLAYGRKRELYVLTIPIPDIAPAKLLCVNVDSGQVNDVTVTRDLPSGSWYTAIAYSDTTDKLHFLNPTERMIYRLSAGLPAGEGLTGQAIPANIPLHTTQGSLAVNPVDGKVWFSTPATPRVFNVGTGFPNPVVTQIPFVGVNTITGIDFDDNGRLYVTADGIVRELDWDGQDWLPAANPFFNGLASSQRITVSRSRTNYDPALHLPTEWGNIDPVEIPEFAPGMSLIDCNADLNEDRLVGVIDLLQVINSWGAPRPHFANIDQSDTVGVGDLLLVINAWGPCP